MLIKNLESQPEWLKTILYPLKRTDCDLDSELEIGWDGAFYLRFKDNDICLSLRKYNNTIYLAEEDGGTFAAYPECESWKLSHCIEAYLTLCKYANLYNPLEA